MNQNREETQRDTSLGESGVFRSIITAALLIIGLMTGAGEAEAVSCSNPWQIADEINAVVTSGQPLNACNWRAELDNWVSGQWDFHCWRVSCSENLPLLAAAVAVMYEPIQNGHDMRQWFLAFLQAQLGKTVTGQTVPANLKYFKGTEMLSPVYDGWSTEAVMAAYYWAVKMQPTAPFAADIKLLADDYLRATFYLWGSATGKSDVTVQYKNDAWFAGGSTKERYPVVAAGARAGATELTNTRTWLFAKVVGLSSTPWRPASLDRLYTTLSSRWSLVHGLSSTQRQYLRDLVLQHQLPPNFNAVVAGLKMARNNHFIIWNGDRLSFFEGSTPNTNKAPVFAQSYYFHPFKSSGGKEVHYLYPFNGKGNEVQGRLTIDAPGSRLKATGSYTAYLSVPTARVIQYHLRLGPSGLTYCPGTLSC